VRLQVLATVTNETSRQLGAALQPAAEGGAPAEQLLDRALASLERLEEIAGAMMRRMDQLPVRSRSPTASYFLRVLLR
jgi:hypothetical protein